MIVPAQAQFAQAAREARARMAAPASSAAPPIPKQKQRVIDALARAERERARQAKREQIRLDRIIKKCRLATAFLPNPKAVIARIKHETAAKHGVTVEQIEGPRRSARIVTARQEAMWRARNETKLSLPALEAHFNRDHTSILWGVRQHEARMAGTSISRVNGAKKPTLKGVAP